MICFDKFDPATQLVANTTYAAIRIVNMRIPCFRVGEFADNFIDIPLFYNFIVQHQAVIILIFIFNYSLIQNI